MKNFIHRFKTYGFFRKLILSYIATFTVVTLISFSLFAVANKIVNNQFSSLSSALLSTFAQNTSANIDTLNSLYMSVPQYFDIYNSKTMDIDQKLKLKSFFDDTISANFINSISMFSLDNNQFTIENNVVLDPKTYYYSFYSQYDKPYEEWLKEIFVRDTNPQYYFDTNNTLRYQRSYIDNSGKYYNIIFLLNSKVFFNYVAKNQNIVLFYNNKCYGANNDICKTGQYFIDNGSTTPFKMNNSKYTVLTLNSDNSNIKYALIQPSTTFVQSKMWFYLTFIVNILAYVIIGMFMTLIMSSRHFKPIESIISVLPKSAKKETEDNVLSLSKHITSIIRQNRELHMLSQNYFSSIRFITLERLLCDYISPLISINTLLNSAGITFPYDTFFVCVYNIDSIDSVNEYDSMSRDEIFYALKNVAIDVFQGNDVIEFTEISGFLACIINIERKAAANIPGLIEYIIEFFKENMHVTLDFRISEAKNTIMDISSCYKQCIADFEDKGDEKSRFLNKLNDDELISRKFNDNYQHIETTATELIKLIRQGRGVSAMSYIEVQLHKGLHYAANTSNLKALLYDLLVSVMTASKSTELEIIDDFSTINNSDELEKYFADTLLKISKPFEQGVPTEENVSDRVYKFITENYNDINLSVQMIGEYCGKVASYASKIFSNEFDVNLLLFIQLYRVNMSINLLKNTSKPINIISSECGFSNSNVYIRTFKKHTNITPGQYRALIKHEHSSEE